jgi:hypothetical protein
MWNEQEMKKAVSGFDLNQASNFYLRGRSVLESEIKHAKSILSKDRNILKRNESF